MKLPAPKRLIISLPALVAGLMIVFWPVAASAACCCKHDEVTKELTVPACQHCCHVVPDQKSEPLQPCECGIGCHSNFAAVLPSVSQVSDEILSTLLPQEDWLQFAGGTPLLSQFVDTGPPRFLLPQARCAQICCWLK
ncbi:hypothetical protein LF1_29210 [Rubripirellula obstinata]|uniref:Secreted protein n=1 Tax=Rubripirellula obstinata TaxID=406547 RepID=A0A5B1CJD0_9BACT|nr:hypothetical protein LF1_29210 [Rubripirellula obstinata]